MQGAPAIRQPVLTPSQSRAIAAKVLHHREHFQTCDGSPLFSLGTPAYRFDGGRDEYIKAVRATNALLKEQFPDLYQNVLTSLGNVLGQRIRLVHDVAFPGFHIMELEQGMSFESGAPHRDAPYGRIPWRDASKAHPEHNLSFVLPLEVPPEGAGIEFYPYRKTAGAPQDWQQLTPVTVNYREGEMCIFSGNRHHRIARVEVSSKARRITLQGHVLRLDGEHIAYW